MASKKHRRKLKAQHQLRNKLKITFSMSDHAIDALRRLADSTNGIAAILKQFYNKNKIGNENNHQSQNEKTSATSERT